MVTSNMLVRRLLSLPNWEPADRKQTKSGCLLILRGMHFGAGLFPEIVILRNHTGPLVNSIMWQEVPFQTIGPFWAVDTIFPASQGIWNCLLPRKWPSWRSWGFWTCPMCLSICCSFRHLYPPVRVRWCLPCLARHLPILMQMVLGSPWWLIETKNPSSPTVTQTVTPTSLTAAPYGGSLLCASLK